MSKSGRLIRATTAEREAAAIASRRARPPMPYSASLPSFLCFCLVQHDASDEIIDCACGRRWVQRDLGGAA